MIPLPRLLSFIAFVAATPASFASDKDPEAQMLRAAGVKPDAPALLDYLSRRVPGADDLKQLDQLIRDLGHRTFARREAASEKLVALGSAALEALRRASQDKDEEIARRARDCIQAIEKGWDPAVATMAVQRLLRLRPDGLVPALVRYLPCAIDEETSETIWFALDALVARDGKVPPAILEALEDSFPVRRALAGYIVARRGDARQRDRAKKLLADADALVRLRVAQGLLAVKDRDALPVLIALLSEPSVELCWQAEELLRWAAGPGAPEALVGKASAEERQRCHKAWEAWWKKSGEKVDLARRLREPARPGLALLCDAGSGKEADGRVWLCGGDGTTRWELTGLANPSDARLLPGGRLLVAECTTPQLALIARRVQTGTSERGLDGTVFWRDREVAAPEWCQRLPNGKTVIADRSGKVVEFQANREVALSFHPTTLPGHPHTYEAPQVLPTGQVVYREHMRHLDWTTAVVEMALGDRRELRKVRFQSEGGAFVIPRTANVERLANGHCLVAGLGVPARGYVLEINGDGQRVWKHPASGARHAVRLRNGNTLIAGSNRLLEMDRDGKVWAEAYFPTSVQRVRDCFGLVRLGFDRTGAGGAAPAITSPAPFSGLSSKDTAIRRRTIAHLAEHATETPGAVPALTALLEDPDETIRGDAKQALDRISKSPVMVLLARLKDKDPQVRFDAVAEFTKHGAAAHLAAPALIELLRDDNPRVRWAAATALGAMRLEAEKVVPALMKAVSDDDADVRQRGVSSLGRFGVAAKPALSLLLETLKGKDRYLRHWAARTLGEIGRLDKEVVPEITKALTESLKDPWARGSAAVSLAWISPETAAGALPALIEAFHAPIKGAPESEIPWILSARTSIVQVFGRMGSHARPTIPLLIGILQDKTAPEDLRRDAVLSLGGIGQAIPEVTAALEAVARVSTTSTLSSAAAETLKKLQPKE